MVSEEELGRRKRRRRSRNKKEKIQKEKEKERRRTLSHLSPTHTKKTPENGTHDIGTAGAHSVTLLDHGREKGGFGSFPGFQGKVGNHPAASYKPKYCRSLFVNEPLQPLVRVSGSVDFLMGHQNGLQLRHSGGYGPG